MGRAEEVDRWLEASWSVELTVGQWWSRLAAAGYAYPRWPTGLGGRDASPAEARLIAERLAAHRVIGPPSGNLAAGLAAPTILAHGTDEQKERFVGAIARGEAAWCQLFSEPGSGSDLASIGTTATRDGEDWIVNGQKVWNSSADRSDLGMLLARTDPDRPKHQGITYFVIDMRQAGVEVRPLRTMNGLSPFCEVFLTDARVSGRDVIGQVNGGWSVAQTTLAAERAFAAGEGRSRMPSASSGRSGDLDLKVADVLQRLSAGNGDRPSLGGYAVPWRVMAQMAQDRATAVDPVLRQELVRYHSQILVNRWLTQRIGAAKGRLTGADGSLAKLATARICQQSRDLAYRVVGSAGMLAGPPSPLGGILQDAVLASPGTRIGGGTDEIQLNILGERALGLPREESADRDIPYRNLKVGTQRSAVPTFPGGSA